MYIIYNYGITNWNYFFNFCFMRICKKVGAFEKATKHFDFVKRFLKFKIIKIAFKMVVLFDELVDSMDAHWLFWYQNLLINYLILFNNMLLIIFFYSNLSIIEIYFITFGWWLKKKNLKIRNFTKNRIIIHIFQCFKICIW